MARFAGGSTAATSLAGDTARKCARERGLREGGARGGGGVRAAVAGARRYGGASDRAARAGRPFLGAARTRACGTRPCPRPCPRVRTRCISTAAFPERGGVRGPTLRREHRAKKTSAAPRPCCSRAQQLVLHLPRAQHQGPLPPARRRDGAANTDEMTGLPFRIRARLFECTL